MRVVLTLCSALCAVLFVSRIVAQPVDASAVMQSVGRESPVRRPIPRMTAAASRAPEYVMLARAAVGEASARVSADEIAAMHAVFTYRHGRTPSSSYNRVVWGFSHAVRNPSKAWLHRLGENDAYLRAPHYVRDNWPRVLDAARSAVSGQLGHGCLSHEGGAAVLVDFGGPSLDEQTLRDVMRRRGWRISPNCSGRGATLTANAFLYAPEEL